MSLFGWRAPIRDSAGRMKETGMRVGRLCRLARRSQCAVELQEPADTPVPCFDGGNDERRVSQLYAAALEFSNTIGLLSWNNGSVVLDFLFISRSVRKK